ncbi:hypothetical protein, partial [Roseomonas sp. CECT 9278]|uniref:hypothetical protein n=1 Tax=Roseomonas sp. CECT 9278 TaxID=2845823 RepID=UPI0027DFA16D
AEARARAAAAQAPAVPDTGTGAPAGSGAATPAARRVDTPLRRALALAAILLGAAMLAWPAVLNGYPLVFIDSVSYLGQTLFPEWPWDKSPAYGPFLHAFHWGWSLWPALAGQALVVSHLLWLAQRAARGGITPGAHLLLCAAMAGMTSLPWFASTLMPDVFAGVAPICLLLLGLVRDRLSRVEAAWLALLGAFAVAVHLSHLPTALALVVFVALATRRVMPPLRAALPVVIATAGLVAANAWAFGKPSLSPHGAVFLLARLQADGPAAATIRFACPRAGWHLCGFATRLPMDSDHFLWNADGPPNRRPNGTPIPMGAMRLAPEASEIVMRTLRERPGEVAAAMARNTVAQAGLFAVGDTLSNQHLAASARRAVAVLPPGELAAFDAGAQMRGALPARAAPYLAAHRPALLGSLLLLVGGLALALWLGDRTRAALAAGLLLAVAVNAFATGALSAPVDRYGARIIWLLPLAALLVLAPRYAGALTDAERVRLRMAALRPARPNEGGTADDHDARWWVGGGRAGRRPDRPTPDGAARR